MTTTTTLRNNSPTKDCDQRLLLHLPALVGYGRLVHFVALYCILFCFFHHQLLFWRFRMPNAMQCFHTGRIYIVFLFLFLIISCCSWKFRMPNAMQCFHTCCILYCIFVFVSSSSAVVLEIQDAQCYAVLSHRKKIDQNGGLLSTVDVTL